MDDGSRLARFTWSSDDFHVCVGAGHEFSELLPIELIWRCFITDRASGEGALWIGDEKI